MRVVLVVVVEPPGDLPKHCSSVRQWLYASVVALEGFDEGFSDAVRLRAVHRGEAWHQAEGGGEVERLPRGERTAIVGQPLDGMWRLDRDKAQLHRFKHQIAYRRAADAGAGHRMPSKHFPVMGIDDEDDADDLSIPADEASRTRPAVQQLRERARAGYV